MDIHTVHEGSSDHNSDSVRGQPWQSQPRGRVQEEDWRNFKKKQGSLLRPIPRITTNEEIEEAIEPLEEDISIVLKQSFK